MDTVKITGLEIFAFHGVHPEENALGQKFVINAELKTDLSKAGASDAIEDSVHYGHASKLIKQIVEGNTFKLIERLAAKIAYTLLKTYPLDSVKIEVCKPQAPMKLAFSNVSVEIERGWHTVYAALGSNLGDREKYLTDAVEALRADDMNRITAVSSFIETKPYGGVEQPDFLNACIAFRTLYSPEELLAQFHRTEAEAQRTREIHWGPRTLDLDILLYDEEVIHTPDLIVPHRDMANRDFVLVPLNEIAPFAYHPVLRMTVSEMLERLHKDRADLGL